MEEKKPGRRVVVRGGRIFVNSRWTQSDIAMEGGVICHVGTTPPRPDDDVIDAGGMDVFPGLIDVHVHFREPGLERKEGWLTGSRGALHGGVTSVLEIQNNPPLTISYDRLLEREEIVKKRALVDFGLFPNLLPDSVDALAAMAPRVPGYKLFMGGSTGVGGVTDYGLLRDLFRAAAAAGRPVVVHAEDESLLRRDGAKYVDSNATFHHLARSTEAETVAISAAIELAAATGAELHVFHISTGRGADLVAQAKATGVRVTASGSPHYLLLTHEISEKIGNFAKVNPSIKTARDRDRLCERLADGTLDAIGTDHAPHPIDEKSRPYATAPSGLPIIDLVFPLLFEIERRGVPLPRLIDSMTLGAMRCFGIHNKGRIAVGADGDLVLIRRGAPRTVAGAALPSKSRWTPFAGFVMDGFPVMTIRGGRIVYHDGNFTDPTPGRMLQFDPPLPVKQ